MTIRCTARFPLGGRTPLPLHRFRQILADRTRRGERLLALFAERSGEEFRLHGLFGGEGLLSHEWAILPPASFRTLTGECLAVHWFEREIHDQFGILPEEHPEGNPLRLHEGWPEDFFPLRGPVPGGTPRREYRFLSVKGEGIHEVPVGPVHAGIIEPGHFRFSCAGETVQNLEIRLGYQHKGTESLLPGAPGMRQILLAESISGDSAVAHANACARLLEAAAGTPAGGEAERWRSVALEIERIANHCGDLGGLATDIGYLFGASHFGRLRGQALNLLMRITGNRYGRGLNRIGGIGPSVPRIDAAALSRLLPPLAREVEETGGTMLSAPSVLARMEDIGRLLPETARTFGIVGPAGRASGQPGDVRRDFPSPAFATHPVSPVVRTEGDVLARARVRHEEMIASFRWLEKALSGPPPETGASEETRPDRHPVLVVSLEEGWRGEIVHAALFGNDGTILRYKAVDPSFRNWIGLSFAIRKNVISDFPLCNKSFNLSYSGADL
ncbi:MAG: NADH-quinone oxidoreductase subunit C [Deltaproteobacteria bacterium]